ncbi:MAG: nitroreductase family protein [Verrucomicrobia bacterium]|nr:nitroreductase family protein [Verrucomicrobiota bacterium]MBU1733708.1 nitroreductase family protein [Verrucomicrobiota bacterium]MBU1858047.1 nitroreductase family protein [Verrucomicrobiota bacterium]
MLQFTVNEKLCTRCGLCAADCPAQIITQEGKALPSISPDQEAKCLQCQHCLAICPTAAISILEKYPANSLPLSADSFPRLDQMARFVRGRRSIRQYKDENVDPALINQLLATLANVPTGVNNRALTFTVIDDKAVMYRLRDKVLAALAALGKAGRIPERFKYLLEAPPAYYEHKVDIIFRGAPHALMVSAPSDAPCPGEDVALTLAYFELLAQSARLGTVWWGMFKMFLELLPDMKALFGLSPRHRYYYGMLFGIPAIHYPRTVQRDDAAIVKRVLL